MNFFLLEVPTWYFYLPLTVGYGSHIKSNQGRGVAVFSATGGFPFIPCYILVNSFLACQSQRMKNYSSTSRVGLNPFAVDFCF